MAHHHDGARKLNISGSNLDKKGHTHKRAPSAAMSSYQMVPTKETPPAVSMQVSERRRSRAERRARSAEDHSAPWSTLLKDFTQETTLHGLRYATAPTRFMLRRSELCVPVQ